MQLAASEALDLSREPKHVHAAYGTEDAEAGIQRGNCSARRLLERGVRFVQVLHTANPGIHTGTIIRATRRSAGKPMVQPPLY